MIKFENICFAYGENVIAKDFSLEIGDGITALLGASGCGKTSLLRLAAGLEKPQAGRITGIDGKRLSFVFSETRLLPWYSAEKNISVVNPQITADELKKIIEMTEVSDFADKMPSELSAGMAQRVSIARMLAYGGDIFMMDEPFKALDGPLKERIMRVCADYGKKNIIFITHEASEAKAIAENVITLSGTPLEVVSSF